MCFFVTNSEYLNCQKQASSTRRNTFTLNSKQLHQYTVCIQHKVRIPLCTIMCPIFDQRFSNIIFVIITTCWQNNPQYKTVCPRKFYLEMFQPASLFLLFSKSQIVAGEVSEFKRA